MVLDGRALVPLLAFALFVAAKWFDRRKQDP